jgi:hypothetical protein
MDLLLVNLFCSLNKDASSVRSGHCSKDNSSCMILCIDGLLSDI